jgi:hypothetical protein
MGSVPSKPSSCRGASIVGLREFLLAWDGKRSMLVAGHVVDGRSRPCQNHWSHMNTLWISFVLVAVATALSVTVFGQETYMYRPENRTFQKMYLEEIAKEAETGSVKSVTILGHVGLSGIYFFKGGEIPFADVLKFAGKCKDGRFSMRKTSVFLNDKVTFYDPEAVISGDRVKLKGGEVIYRHGNVL